MRRLAATLLLVACDKGGTASSEPSPPARDEPEVKVEGPPAALRRELRTCEREMPGLSGEIEYGVRVSPAGEVVLAKALHSSS